MIISVNWLKKYTDIDCSVDELAALIGSRLVEIEEVIDLGKKYEGVLVAKVIECHKLEGSDHLNVTKIDDGQVTEGIERDENGLIQVVCGAPNVRSEMLVAWLPPNSTIPETVGGKEPFILGSRKLRGAVSNGMLASAKELDLFDDHTGILEVDKDAAPGSSFREVYELDDYLFDIENKSLTHRPDAFGVIGFAREVAAIQGKAFLSPDWFKNEIPEFQIIAEPKAEVTVAIDDPILCDRYQAVVLRDAVSSDSPLQIQTYLSRVGVRPISAIVDVTNYLMMATGQPLHAFDYDKLVAVSGGRAEIHVRAGRDDEELTLLDGRTITLSTDDIIIVAGDTPIGLAGAMGGLETEIDDTTTTIVLESATFNLYKLRSTQMRHGIFSEAITRFTKGQPAALTAPVLGEAIKMMGLYSGAVQVSPVYDVYPEKRVNDTIVTDIESINGLLGSIFSAEDAVDLLQNVEFSVGKQEEGRKLAFQAPYWRSDIHIAEDVIEEIGRLNGYDSLTPTLASRDFTAIRPTVFDEMRKRIRKQLVRAGLNEVLTYSFVHGNTISRANQDVSNAYRITNSISPDLQFYRQSLTPSLLGIIHPNVKQGYESFGVFELNKAHPKSLGLTEEEVPEEIELLACVVTSSIKTNSAPYYQAKTILEYLVQQFGLQLRYEPLSSQTGSSLASPFEPLRSASIFDKQTGTYLGIVGEYTQSVARGFKLPQYTAGFEIDTHQLSLIAATVGGEYKPLSRYPSAERDICFQVDEKVTYEAITNCLSTTLANFDYIADISPLDIYKGTDDGRKNVTVRLQFTSYDHTLTGEEIRDVVHTLSTAAGVKLGATTI